MRLVSATEFRRRLELLEAWIWNDAVVALDLPALSVHALAQRVLELSDLYTLERELLETVSLRRGHFLARLLYFLCSDAPKLFLVLEELERRGELAAVAPRRVVDLGCGLGASAAGALLAQQREPSDPPLHLVGVDRDAQALAAWREVVQRCATIAGVSVTQETQEADLREVEPDPSVDMVLCQTALNECLLPPERQGDVPRYDEAMVDRLARWSCHATTVLIEPALRIAARPLHDLRDRVLAWSPTDRGTLMPTEPLAESLAEPGDAPRGAVPALRVLAPCPHQSRCPMLASPRDWCHEVRAWPPTSRAAEIQRLTRRRDDRAKFSFVVLGPAPRDDQFRDDQFRDSGLMSVTISSRGGELDARVVSDPLATKGKLERFLCTRSGELRRLRLLDRERTPSNELLATARRGELLAVQRRSDQDRVNPADSFLRWPPER